MSYEWLPEDWSTVWRIPAAAALVLVWATFTVRIVGLRSLSKMTSVDFVATVALGSIVGATAITSVPFWKGALAFSCLLAVQWFIARLRRIDAVSHLIENEPLLLMDGATILDDNMRRARITDNDLWAKLREANVTDRSQVRAVVLETTGDVSVLHDDELDRELLTGVVGLPDRQNGS